MSSIAKNEHNQKQVQILNELSKRKVVEHNSLITSIAKMDKTPLKMFELAVSCIDTEEPPTEKKPGRPVVIRRGTFRVRFWPRYGLCVPCCIT